MLLRPSFALLPAPDTSHTFTVPDLDRLADRRELGRLQHAILTAQDIPCAGNPTYTDQMSLSVKSAAMLALLDGMPSQCSPEQASQLDDGHQAYPTHTPALLYRAALKDQ